MATADWAIRDGTTDNYLNFLMNELTLVMEDVPLARDLPSARWGASTICSLSYDALESALRKSLD
jgi:hypothetical protein